MNRSDIQKRIKALNEFMLFDSDKELLLLKISSDYTYNKAIALINRDCDKKDWYSISDKDCFKTWDEIDAFIDGICKGKNTDFCKQEQER